MSEEETLSLNGYLEDLYQAMVIGDIVFEANHSLKLYNLIHKLLKENKKYQGVINELRNYLEARIEVCDNRLSTPFCNFERTTKERLILSQCFEKLEELEAEDK